MGSFIRKAGYVAAAAALTLGVTSLPATADNARDKDQPKDISVTKAVKEGQQKAAEVAALQHAKYIGGKRVTTYPVACTEAALTAGWAAATGQTASIYNLVLASNCTYTLVAIMNVPISAQVMVTGGTNTTITGGGDLFNFTTAVPTAVAAGGILRLYNLTITGMAPTAGGAIANQGTLTVYNCTIRDNTGTGAGGGVGNLGGTASIYNSTIRGNTATTTGGGVSNVGGDLYMYNTLLYRNEATGNGGGLYHEDGVATLTYDWFDENTSAADGGGAYNAALGLMNGIGSLWTENEADNGGGIASADGFYGSSIGLVDNTAAVANGGGFWNSADTDAVATFRSGYINDNTATGQGGGIFNAGLLAAVNVSGTTLSGNTPNSCTNTTGC